MKHLHLTILSLLLSVAVYAVPGPIAGANHVCIGSTTTLTDGTGGGIWSSSASTIASVGFSSGVVTGAGAGIATITYTVGASFVTLDMTVNPLPATYTVTGSSYCAGSTGGYIYLDGSDAGVNYQLYRSGILTGTAMAGTSSTLTWGPFTTTGSYTVIATNPTSGCTRNMTGIGSISINPLPTVYTLYTPGSGTFCAGSSANIILSGSNTGNSYRLYIGTSFIALLAGTNSLLDFGPYSVAGIYTATAENLSTGCVSTMAGAVTLSSTAAPDPILGASGLCVGSTTTLSEATTGGVWSSSSPGVATVGSTGIVTGIGVGSATISYTIPSGCAATTTINVINLVMPITGANHLCAGGFTTLSSASAGGTWVSTNPAVATIGSASGLVSGLSAGTTIISYTLGGTCGAVTLPMTVNIAPAPITGITSICAGGTTSLADITTGGTWSSSNTSVATVGTSGIVSTILAGSSTINYTLGSGCSSSVLLSIDPPPIISGPGTLCVSSTISLVTSIAGSWSSSNPFVASISPAGVVTGAAPGTATITCTSFSTGCVSTHNLTVTSSCSGTPAAGVAHAASTSICANNADLLYLTGASTACGIAFQWQYSTDSIWWVDIPGATNDSFIANPQVPLYYRGRAKCYTSGLFAYSAPVHIGVFNNITSHSVITTPSYFCNGPDFHLTTCGLQPGSNIMTYYGDGTSDSTHMYSSSADIVHTYLMAGTYTVKQILRDGVIAQDSVTFTYNYNYCRTLPVMFYFDANNSCTLDAGDRYVYHPVTTEVDSNGIAIDTITAISGFYYKALGDSGTVYRFKIISADTGLHKSCPTSGILYDTITSFVNTYAPLNFGFNCTTSSIFDLGVNASITCGRHEASGYIYANNTFCTVENPVVTMTFSPHYIFNGSWPAPYSVVGNVVTWHLTGVSVYTYGWSPYIYFDLSVPGPFLTAGDTIQTSFAITPLSGDITPANNFYSTIDTIRASYDPNGITVSPKGQVISCTPLEYTIRFENTGNDTARNIHVIDTLPDNLNARSLKLVSATSVVNLATTTYSGHTVIKFDFPNINLPDSSHHNVCHGAVTFTVKAKAGLADGIALINHASIYFDDNLPVLTDTAISIIGISPITGPGTVCTGTTIMLADGSAGGTWSAVNTHATITGGLVSGATGGTDTIRYLLMNSCTTKVATKTITINAMAVPAVSINPGTGMGDSICTGAVPVFTAVPANGGTAPVYEWKLNGTSVSVGSSFSYAPADSDILSLKLTSNAECVLPDTATTFTVLNVLAPNVPVDSMVAIPGILISAGTADTFVAIITSPGTRPTFEWLLNGLPTGDTSDTFVTHTLVDQDSVTCITTSTDICHLSSFNSFIISVSPVGVKSLSTIGGLSVYPNPNRGEFTIKGSLVSAADEDVTIEITNMLGQAVFYDKTLARKGSINARIKINQAIANGMYMLTLRSGSASQAYHFVVEQ